MIIRLVSIAIALMLLLLFSNQTNAKDDPITITTLPFNLNASSGPGNIDMDGNLSPDFYIEYWTNGSSYSLMISGIGANKVLVEYFTPPIAAPIIGYNPPLTANPHYTSILPAGILIGPTSIPSRALFKPNPNPTGPFWDNYGIIYKYNPPKTLAGLTSTTMSGANSGYIGVYYLGNGGNYYYGWISVQNNPAGASLYIPASGSSSSPGSSVPAGGAAVPVSMYISLLTFLIVGIGIYYRKRLL